MVKQSIHSMWLISLFLLTISTSSLAKPFEGILKQRDLANPDYIVAWLRENSPQKEQINDAKIFFKYGLKATNPASTMKSFGESAIRYPSPQTIIEYTNAELKMLGRDGFLHNKIDINMADDMKRANLQYQSALAADGVLHSLSKKEKIVLQNNINCLTEYLNSGVQEKDCLPIKYFLDNAK